MKLKTGKNGTLKVESGVNKEAFQTSKARTGAVLKELQEILEDCKANARALDQIELDGVYVATYLTARYGDDMEESTSLVRVGKVMTNGIQLEILAGTQSYLGICTHLQDVADSCIKYGNRSRILSIHPARKEDLTLFVSSEHLSNAVSDYLKKG